jgi:Ran GTPase-activating protein (RanGAP) involved in mRNA processing and transport
LQDAQCKIILVACLCYKNLKVLNFSKNSLTFDFIRKFLKVFYKEKEVFPVLEKLNLCENRIRIREATVFPNFLTSLRQKCPAIKCLNFSDILIESSSLQIQVWKNLSAFPHLKELHLSGCSLSENPLDEGFFQLREINLANNQLGNFYYIDFSNI